MAVDLDRIGRASLKELGDIRIDDVLSFIDRGIENMPSYMDLYRRWEAQQWAVADLDFTLDREDWLQATDLEKRRPSGLIACSSTARSASPQRSHRSCGPPRRPRSRCSYRLRWSMRRATQCSSSAGGTTSWAPRPKT